LIDLVLYRSNELTNELIKDKAYRKETPNAERSL
jgi:hypothetical protein